MNKLLLQDNVLSKRHLPLFTSNSLNNYISLVSAWITSTQLNDWSILDTSFFFVLDVFTLLFNLLTPRFPNRADVRNKWPGFPTMQFWPLAEIARWSHDPWFKSGRDCCLSSTKKRLAPSHTNSGESVGQAVINTQHSLLYSLCNVIKTQLLIALYKIVT